MDKEILKYVLAQSTERELPPIKPRALVLPTDSGKVVTLVGIRRCGKTFLLFETMRRLVEQGVDRRRMVYLNFEDDRLLPIATGELDLILRAHAELYPEIAGQKKYLFFDEVQGVPRWETYVRRLHDTEEASIFVTGSSSQLLSRELATGLRGRSLPFEVFPLSFSEFLAFRGVEHKPWSRASEARMVAALEDYLELGGLPEIVLAEPALRPRILKEYVDLVFYKDLVERYSIGNLPLMRQLLKHCLGHPACLLNAHKLYSDFRSQGFKISKDTVYHYLDCLVESYLIFTVPIADRSVRRQAVNPRKLHAVDWALGYPFVPQPQIDRGRRLETAVFLHWRRQREDLAYLGGDHEIDLVVNPEQFETMINVALSVGKIETWQRETSALQRAGERHPEARRLLVLHETSARRPPADVEIIDAWRHLIEAGSAGSG